MYSAVKQQRNILLCEKVMYVNSRPSAPRRRICGSTQVSTFDAGHDKLFFCACKGSSLDTVVLMLSMCLTNRFG